MPKGNVNIVHDELIWKDYIKVHFKNNLAVNIDSFLFQESKQKSRNLGEKLGLHQRSLLKYAGKEDSPAIVIRFCRKK